MFVIEEGASAVNLVSKGDHQAVALRQDSDGGAGKKIKRSRMRRDEPV